MRSSALVACLFCLPAVADEVRLKDGRVLFGKVEKTERDVVVETREGEVRVRRDEVVSLRTEQQLRDEFQALAARSADSAFAHLQLAKLAGEQGLVPELWQQLDRTLELTARRDGDAYALHEQALGFLASLEYELLGRRFQKAAPERRVGELLTRVRAGVPKSKVQAIEELLVREKDADKALRLKARHGLLLAQRLVAVQALARRAEKGNDLFVYRTMLLDPAQQIRDAAADMTRAGNRTGAAVAYLAPALASEDATVRIRTAEAFARLGDKDAIAPLVAAGPNAGKGGGSDAPRAHIAFTTQQSYIRDFDVEVAQSAFIANPQIDVLQYGTVLDVAVLGVQIYRYEIVLAYRKALTALAGSDPGGDPSKWTAWAAGR